MREHSMSDSEHESKLSIACVSRSRSPTEVAVSTANGSTSASSEKSPLNNLGFLKNLNPDKKPGKDGLPPKRRGPKPDSKPALTRRQELNRQAQRTHRERKEMYIKALEQEVLRLKETFTTTTRERDAIAEENRKLRELLATHGIHYDFSQTPVKFQREGTSYGPSSSGSISGSYAPHSESNGFSPPVMAGQLQHGPGPNGLPGPPLQSMAQLPNTRLDYDAIGIDFVLTLERPCMDHMQYLLVRSHNVENLVHRHPMESPDDADHEHMSGHALMATAPPHSHIMQTPAEQYTHKMPEHMTAESLSKLLDLSSRLPFNHYSEITPIMAWTQILRHEQLADLTVADLQAVKTDLAVKVRCYGFGAVLEEYELNDALEEVLSRKSATPPMNYAMATQQVAAY